MPVRQKNSDRIGRGVRQKGSGEDGKGDFRPAETHTAAIFVHHVSADFCCIVLSVDYDSGETVNPESKTGKI